MRTRRHRPKVMDVREGDLDAVAWEAFAAAVRSAHNADAGGHVAALRELTRRLDLAQRAGMFVWFALRYQVATVVEGAPDEDDVHRIAAEAGRRMSVLPDIGEATVRDALLTVFDMAPPERRIVGGDLIVIGTAVLGALVNSADSDLSTIRGDMAEWYVQKKGAIGLA